MVQKKIEAEKNGERYGKTYHKLMNNAGSDKKMVNLRKRADIRLVNNEKDVEMYINTKLRNTQNVWQRFGSNSQIKTTLTLNKSPYDGICILKLSNVQMYECQYDSIKKKYGNKKRLLSTNTDCLEYETENSFDDFNKNIKNVRFQQLFF